MSDKHLRPSLIFDKKYGTKFGYEWKMSFQPSQLEEFICKLCDGDDGFELMICIFNILKNKNPSLEKFDFDLLVAKEKIPKKYLKYVTELRHNIFTVLVGITSGFDLDDIYDFVTIGGGWCRDTEYKRMVKEVEKIYGYIGWVPSKSKLIQLLQNEKSKNIPKRSNKCSE